MDPVKLPSNRLVPRQHLVAVEKTQNDGLVINPCHFNGDDRVDDSSLIACGTGLERHGSESLPVAVDARWFDNDMTVKITKHPFASQLRTIHGDDREPVGSSLLDPRLNDPTRSAKQPTTGSRISGRLFRFECHLRISFSTGLRKHSNGPHLLFRRELGSYQGNEM